MKRSSNFQCQKKQEFKGYVWINFISILHTYTHNKYIYNKGYWPKMLDSTVSLIASWGIYQNLIYTTFYKNCTTYRIFYRDRVRMWSGLILSYLLSCRRPTSSQFLGQLSPHKCRAWEERARLGTSFSKCSRLLNCAGFSSNRINNKLNQ